MKKTAKKFSDPGTIEMFPRDIIEGMSPRLNWISSRKIFTRMSRFIEQGDRWAAWTVFQNPMDFILAHGEKAMGYGKTEDDALADLARKNGWRLWNEEGEFVA